MITLQIKFNERSGALSYPITIGSDILPHFSSTFDLSPYSTIAVVIEEKLIDPILPKILASLPEEKTAVIPLEAGEENKGMEQVAVLWAAFLEAGLDRRSLIFNVGGGVATDLSGFAASTFMRGVDFIQVPTTLLAQVDASLGGKVGVNFAGIKNLVGSFNQPRAVVIDVKTLDTLPLRQYLSGFAEIIKHGLINDAEFFAVLEDCADVTLDDESLVKIISRSCQIKASIVEKDEKEGGLRKLLNFGHTIGHAIESYSHEIGQPLLHGEAISIGMVAESRISCLAGMISDAACQRIEDTLVRYQLPIRIPFEVENESLLAKMRLDKKNIAGVMKWTLLNSIGSGVYDQHISATVLNNALNYVKK